MNAKTVDTRNEATTDQSLETTANRTVALLIQQKLVFQKRGVNNTLVGVVVATIVAFMLFAFTSLETNDREIREKMDSISTATNKRIENLSIDTNKQIKELSIDTNKQITALSDKMDNQFNALTSRIDKILDRNKKKN